MNTPYTNFGLLILRLGLAVVFLHSGIEALERSDEMIEIVEKANFSPFDQNTLLNLVGIWDTTMGVLLLSGLWLKKLAWPAAAWLLFVILVLAKYLGEDHAIERLPYLAMAISVIFLGGGEWNLNKFISFLRKNNPNQ